MTLASFERAAHQSFDIGLMINTTGGTTVSGSFYEQKAKKAKLRLINGQTGELKLYSIASFNKLLKRDQELYLEYERMSLKQQKDMMFIFLKEFNKKHPFYIKRAAYK